ncbi:hypothetical protein NW759_014682 [Fusarium solani]|nr:hypothetical protein NW759_014682 [Fusarium solani]
MSSMRSPESASSTIDALDEDHRHVFTNAIKNILATDLAEFTYAQILDGLPAEESVRNGFHFMHVICVMKIRVSCPSNCCGAHVEVGDVE